VFEFTIDPKNTPKWIFSIKEEVSDCFPPKIGTKYKNTGDHSLWDFYKVVEFKEKQLFTLSDLDNNYHVRYSYESIDENKTKNRNIL